MNNTERLIGKMNDELAAFVAGLERLPVQDVIEKAGEIAVKTDMALLVEEAFLGPKETKALLGMQHAAGISVSGVSEKDTGLSKCSDRPYAGCGGRGSRTAAKKKPGKNCGRSPIEKTEDTEHDKTADESDRAGGA